jgi:GTP-binding protein
LKILSAEFVRSEADVRMIDCEGLPEIVLIGKSNVGKSSFLNRFANRKSLARISSSPGRTQTANLYKVNGSFYFVDMPGYGYAKASKAQRASYAKILSDYIQKRKADFAVYFLIDIRHEPTSGDMEMWAFLIRAGVNPVVILTKADKIPRSNRSFHIKRILGRLGRESGEGCFPFSVHEGPLVESVRDFTETIVAGS